MSDRTVAIVFTALAAASVPVAFGDHKLEPKHFDHVMYSPRHQKGLTDSALALDCDRNFASIDPGGFVSLDIGHKRQFGAGPDVDLTIFSGGEVAFQVLVGRGASSPSWDVLGESSEKSAGFEITSTAAFQYIRIKNLGSRELKLDCALAHNLFDQPSAD